MLLPLLLFGAVSLVSARCNNALLCPNSACCGASPVIAFTGPYGIFNQGNIGYGASYNVRSSGSGFGRRSSCLNVDTIPVYLSDLYCNQPIYARIVENSEENQRIDNVCNTMVPVPGDDKTVIVYSSTVYIDGSNEVVSAVLTNTGAGTFSRANSDFTITERVFGRIGEDIYVSCTRNEYGVSSYPKQLVTTFSLRPFCVNCVEEIQRIYECNGLSQCNGLYVLPYNLPTRCVVPKACPLQNPFLYVSPSYGVFSQATNVFSSI